MFGIGLPELLIIMFIVLVIFGAGKIPEIMSGFGGGIRDFREAINKPFGKKKEIDNGKQPNVVDP